MSLASRPLLTVLAVLGLDNQTLTLVCVLDSITASDEDDVSALWQPLYESVGHVLR